MISLKMLAVRAARAASNGGGGGEASTGIGIARPMDVGCVALSQLESKAFKTAWFVSSRVE